MKIYNKVESSNAIKELRLNHFPEKIFSKGQTDEVLEFLKRFPAKYYALRDKSKTGGFSSHKIKQEDVLEKIKVYDDKFSINVSSFNYIENQILVGEIQITDTSIYILGSTNNEYSLRDAYKDPDFNLNTTIFDDKNLSKIPHFDDLYTYIMNYNLQGVVVEFAIFNKPVGINNENIIIYELRTNY